MDSSGSRIRGEDSRRGAALPAKWHGSNPRHAAAAQRSLDKAKTFAEAARRIANEDKVPLVDYLTEVLTRPPDDWDGPAPKFKVVAKDAYQLPTLISGDGVHASNPVKFQDYSEENLKSNGYVLHNYLGFMAYAE